MLDILFQLPAFVWLVTFAATIGLAAILAKAFDLEGVNLTATPPFITFRFKRKPARQDPAGVQKPDASIPSQTSASGERAVAIGGNSTGTTIITGDVHLPPPERPPAGSAPPPSKTAHYVRRGNIENQVRDLLQAQTSVAVVGVAGMGGIGKTELARYLAGELGKSQRVIWLQVNDRSLGILQGELGRALGITFDPRADDLGRYETLCAAFEQNPCIVVFDDVYRDAIPHLQKLLPPSPPCAALVTSRQRELGLARVIELDVMSESQSLELLREAHDLGDAMAREPDAAQKLCALCGYLPLALDIAASRLRKQLHFSHTPIAQFNEALANRLRELQRGVKPDRLDSITANLDLSYADLSADEQKRLRALSVFAPSGFMPLAVSAVWREDAHATRTHIEQLQNGSLVMNDADHVGRFRLHDLVRDYAAQKLNAADESDATNRAHAEFLIALFDKNYDTDDSGDSFVKLELENLRVAGNWARRNHNISLLAQLATRPRNWLLKAYRTQEDWEELWNDWENWLKDVVTFRNEVGTLAGYATQILGDVQQHRDKLDDALESYQMSLIVFREIGARLGEANVLQAIGDVQQFRKEIDAALTSYAQALELFRSVGDRLGEANVLAAQSRLQIASGNIAQAEQDLAQVIAIRRSIPSLFDEGADYGNFSLALLNVGDKAKAKTYVLKAKQVFEKIGEPYYLQWVENVLKACE